MKLNDIITAVGDAEKVQVVAGDVIVMDENNKHVLMGKLTEDVVLATEAGTAFLKDLAETKCEEAPKVRRTRAKAEPTPTEGEPGADAPIETAPMADLPEGLTLGLSSGVAVEDSVG